MNVYFETLAEVTAGPRSNVCAECGRPFCGSRVSGSDGRERHPECADRPSRFARPPAGESSPGWTPPGMIGAK